MWKRYVLVAGIMALTSALAAQGEEIQNPWSAKIFGGGWFGRNDDIRTYVLAYDRYFQQWAQAYGYTKTGAFDWPVAGAEFGGEIARRFSPRVSAGLAFEILSKSHSGSFELDSGNLERMDMTMKAVSVTAFGGYAWPVTKAISITLKAGLGALFGSLDQARESREADGGGVMVNASLQASGLTARAGLGLEWNLTARLALSLEAGYRLASLSNWNGEDVHDWGSGSARHYGTVYYVEMQIDTDRIPSVYFPGLILGDPSQGTRVMVSRMLRADYSGYYLQGGVLYRFGR